jgi:hypothetical protein
MNQALASGETKRINNAEENLKKKFNKLRGGIRLPNGDAIQMDEQTYNGTSIGNAYEASNVFDPSVAGRETQVERMETLKADRPEGFSDRPRPTGPTPDAAKEIRPIILGAGNNGFEGNQSGIIDAANNDAAQYDALAGNLSMSSVTRFSKDMMLSGMYGDVGQGYGDKKNEEAAQNIFKASNLLMTEDSPAGKDLRAAYTRALFKMLGHTADFVPSNPDNDYVGWMEQVYNGSMSPDQLIAKIDSDLTAINGRARGGKIFQVIQKANVPGYFVGGRVTNEPKDTHAFQSALNRAKSAIYAYSKAKRLADPTSDVGMRDIDSQQIVFFASPWQQSKRSLLAVPSIDGVGSARVTVVKKAESDLADGSNALPPVAYAYDLPAAFAQKKAGDIFAPLNEALSQNLQASNNPAVKDALAEITKRQEANHQPDMTANPLRRALKQDKTFLSANGKAVGRRWLIEGALMYNFLNPVRNLQFRK